MGDKGEGRGEGVEGGEGRGGEGSKGERERENRQLHTSFHVFSLVAPIVIVRAREQTT